MSGLAAMGDQQGSPLLTRLYGRANFWLLSVCSSHHPAMTFEAPRRPTSSSAQDGFGPSIPVCGSDALVPAVLPFTGAHCSGLFPPADLRASEESSFLPHNLTLSD